MLKKTISDCSFLLKILEGNCSHLNFLAFSKLGFQPVLFIFSSEIDGII